ncbi:RanGTP-binding protein-domain-containing protein [Elsinoe ampelina]|uniref:RanGTP-binding protein-domain-containing protein n=1 Tax=Elsinoe ampelina TaxID=302913 RepID=A0A6A6GPK4_9PEZI|nr:RanGTP-binding protein-domain-containing protein [Elsinoe ampelina]
MDVLLNKVTQQAINYAIRSGVAVTGGYAMKQCARLLSSTPKGGSKNDLRNLQIRLESKIRIISPAIDMIELIAARGNTSLESAVELTKELRFEIQSLGVRLSNAANEEELLRRRSPRAKSREQNELELQLVIADMRRLLTRIEDAVPLINLAITTSGVNLSTNLPATVSPSRLLQASTLLTATDAQYAEGRVERVQVGPVHVLSMYMLFAGHAWRPQDDEDIRATTWKEVIHKARVKLVRLPIDQLYDVPGTRSADGHNGDTIPAEDAAGEFSYQLLLIEDLDDDRVHTFDDGEMQPGPFDGVSNAGIRDVIPIHQISKIFYADTGKILNIGSEGETNSPVLLLKRDIHAEPPRRMMERQASDDAASDDENNDTADLPHPVDDQNDIDAQIRRESTLHGETAPQNQSQRAAWKLPQDLDPEWIAFEVYTEQPDSEDESDLDYSAAEQSSSRTSVGREDSTDSRVTNGLSRLDLNATPDQSPAVKTSLAGNASTKLAQTPIKTSLSLLEMLIRLTALQQFRQASHLTIEDELLNFFLEDSSTTGAGPNAEYRQRVRRDARLRLGFDPYDESPLKRRGEEYIAHAGSSPRQEEYYDDYSNREWLPDLARPSVETPPQSNSRYRSSPSPSMRHMRPRPSSTRSSPMPQTPAPSRPGLDQNSFSDARSRQAVLRAQSEKPRSPLGMVRRESKTDSGLGTSPANRDELRTEE